MTIALPTELTSHIMRFWVGLTVNPAGVRFAKKILGRYILLFRGFLTGVTFQHRRLINGSGHIASLWHPSIVLTDNLLGQNQVCRTATPDGLIPLYRFIKIDNSFLNNLNSITMPAFAVPP